jgi:integrase
VATRAIGLLGGIFSYAVNQNIRADNPAHRIRKYAENKRERRLSDAEYAALGERLRQAEGKIWPQAIACTRFLSLIGWRSGEALALRWREVDLARRTATLPDTKTGRSARGGRTPHVTFCVGWVEVLTMPWCCLPRVATAGLPQDVTAHVLRHSFASLAADLGYSEPTIAALVGHNGHVPLRPLGRRGVAGGRG